MSLLVTQAHAIENGESALNHSRILQHYLVEDTKTNFLRPSCSGWLYSPRIVFTAGHCVYNNQLKPLKILNNPLEIYVGKPGSVRYFGPPESQVRAAKVFAYDSFEWYQATPGGTLSYKDDFAVIVLEKPLSNVSTAKIATKEFLDSLLSKGEFIETGGYGFQDNSRQFKLGDEPKKAKFQLISFDTGMKTVNEFKQKWNRTYFQEEAMFVKLPKNGAAPCDGDSGSGYFYNSNGEITYLGTMMGLLGSPNCGLDTWTENAVGPFRPIYFDLDLIRLAEKYVSDNPYIEIPIKKYLICSKGKLTKTISSLNPKCPSGFKIALPKEGQTCMNFGEILKGLTCAELNKKLIWLTYTLSESINGRPKIGSRCFRENLIVLGIDSENSIQRTKCSYKNAPGAFPSWTI